MSYEQSIKIQEMLKLVDNLAEFHCFYMESNLLKKFEGDFLYGVNDDRIKKYFREGLNRFMLFQKVFTSELKSITKYLDKYFDLYFELLSKEPRTICHGDFNISNVMFGKTEGSTDRICFIDWQTAFIGNGMVDLANVLYYSGDVAMF